MHAIEGCSSISDTSGNILFYTNGDTVWNRNHAIMPNGTGLFGGFSSTQGNLIVPFPSNPDNYYIFTTDGGDIPYNGTKGLRYSVVDMTLNSGLGDVSIKNDSLFARVTEKLTAVKHSNGTDVWVIAHQLDSARFIAYLVTSSGVSSIPVISNIGQTYIFYSSSIGQLKASPDGSKIAAAKFGSYPSSAEVFQFDNSTGILSNAIQLTIPSTSYTYGVDFSPSGNKVYFASDDTPKTIYQFDLSVWNSTSINASKILIGTTSSSRICGMQIGPDGKIYVAHNDWPVGGAYLGVINNPELTGTSCNYVDNGLYLNGNSCNFGLPAFVQSYFLTPLPTSTSTASFSSSNQFFPNPFKDETILRVPDTQEKVNFLLYNSSGQIVMAIDNVTNGQVVIDRKELESGIYYFTIKTEDKLISTGKLIAE